MYLNRLNTEFINDIKTGIVSADLTDGEIQIDDHLDKIDYLFLSDENLHMDIDELGKLVKKGFEYNSAYEPKLSIYQIKKILN